MDQFHPHFLAFIALTLQFSLLLFAYLLADDVVNVRRHVGL